MDEHPGLIGRVVARLHHEIAADALESYRRAGVVVYRLQEELDQVRLDALVHHEDPWLFPEATQVALLCGWNAFALQLLGDRLLCADYEADPLTVGYVEGVIADQALAYYGQVPGWLSRSQQALHSPAYELDVAVPAPLPAWIGRGWTGVYVAGLYAGLEAVRSHAEAALVDFRPTLTGDARSRAHHRLEALVAEATAAADYAAGLGAAGGVANDEVLGQIQAAIGRYYLVGQLVAMPALALKPFPRAIGARRVRLAEPRLLPVPDAPGFDRWCLTDPRVVPVLKRAKRACRTIDALWRDDGDPTRTLAIKADIDAALFRGDVALEAGHFDTCPWSPIYLVKRPVRIGGRRLHPLDEFTYVVEVVPGLRQSRVRRRIVTGPFYPSRRKAEHGAR